MIMFQDQFVYNLVLKLKHINIKKEFTVYNNVLHHMHNQYQIVVAIYVVIHVYMKKYLKHNGNVLNHVMMKTNHSFLTKLDKHVYQTVLTMIKN